MELRLQKFLAQAGVASRRKAEELILDGKIIVNDKVLIELGTKINTNKDVVKYNNKIVELTTEFSYIMLHKPEGFVTTSKDQFDRPTVIDIIKDKVKERVVPVGRLDYDTSGLLILTNDGDLTYKITHPKNKVDKVYIAKVVGIPGDKQIKQFKYGIEIEGYTTAPAYMKVLKSDDRSSTVTITIHEGKNRQIRKMCEIVGHKVISLKRIATGKVQLGELKRGAFRHLTNEEVKYLKSL